MPSDATRQFLLRLKQLNFISAVDKPAQEPAVVVLIKGSKQLDIVSKFVPAVKVSDELGLVFGWAMVNARKGEDYFDLQGDHIDAQSMMAAAAEFMSRSRAQDAMHDYRKDGEVVFAMPMTPEVAKAFGVQTDTYGLMIAVRPSPEVLAKFKSGEFTGFSIAGIGERETVKTDNQQENTVKLDQATIISALKQDPTLRAALIAAMKSEFPPEEDDEEEDEEMASENKRLSKSVETLTAERDGLRAQLEQVTKLHDPDQVAYRSDSGEVFRKSDDPRLVQMAKDRDHDRREAAQARLEKRASEEIPALKGTLPVRSAILRAVDGIADEATRKAAHEALRGASFACAELAKALGGPAPNMTDDSAATKLHAMVVKHAGEKSMSEAAALVDLTSKSQEARDLYEAVRAERDASRPPTTARA